MPTINAVSSAENETLDQSIVIQTEPKKLRELVDDWKSGKLIAFHKWLQRLDQQKKWTSQKNKSVKSYLKSLFKTRGISSQGFIVCNIDVLIEDLQLKIDENSDVGLVDIWNEMIQWLEGKRNQGAVQIILDGQNRLKYALNQFIYGNLEIDLEYGGKTHLKKKYTDLPKSIKNQIDNIDVLVSTIKKGDIQSILSSLISINEGEPWSSNEKRSVKFTATSYRINDIVSISAVKNFFDRIFIEKIFPTDNKYSMSKKGQILFVAEIVHYMRNGSVGNDKSLDEMYEAKDENISKQLELAKDLFVWICTHFPSSHFNSKQLKKEIFRDLFIFILPLIYDQAKGAEEFNQINLSDIKNPKEFLTRLVEDLEDKRSDESQIEEVDGKKTESNARPGTFMRAHKDTSKTSLKLRRELYMEDFEELVEECRKLNIIDETSNPRNIDAYKKSQAVKKYQMEGDPYELFKTANLKSLNGYELDHKVSVKNGGSAEVDNLTFTTRINNRKKGSR